MHFYPIGIMNQLTRVHYVILLVLSILPVAMTLMAWPLLQDAIFMQLVSGGDDRYGSSYEFLMVSVIMTGVGLIMVRLPRSSTTMVCV
jgi:hypothetical protein